MEDACEQITEFVDIVMEKPSINLFFHQCMEEKGYIIVKKDIYTNEDINLQTFVNKGLKKYFRDYQKEYKCSPNETLVNHQISKLLDEAKRDAEEDPEVEIPKEEEQKEEQVTISREDLEAPYFQHRSRINREAGVRVFLSNCKESKTLLNTVALYDIYAKWCKKNSYGAFTPPSLTAYLRKSDKKHLESVSDKSRSQGWYIVPPT